MPCPTARMPAVSSPQGLRMRRKKKKGKKKSDYLSLLFQLINCSDLHIRRCSPHSLPRACCCLCCADLLPQHQQHRSVLYNYRLLIILSTCSSCSVLKMLKMFCDFCVTMLTLNLRHRTCDFLFLTYISRYTTPSAH